MSSINDYIKRFTGGNSVPDGLADWYSKTGTESLPDAERRWLLAQDGTADDYGTNQDLWNEILINAGFTSGGLPFKLKEYWKAPVVFQLGDSSLSPVFGTGGTFARATTATVEDHEDVIREVLSGEVRFQGQRRVENSLTASEDFSDAAWTKVNTATVTGTNTLNFPAVLDQIKETITVGSTDNKKYVARVELSGSGTITLQISNGVSAISQQVTITAAVQTFSVAKTFTDDNTIVQFNIYRNTGDTCTTLTANYAQFQDKTGASDPAVPDAYVSTGVLSAPYHGANVDGVKYFLSTNGNSVVSNVVVEASGAAITDAIGYFGEPASTNKCTNYNANPDAGLVNTQKTGDAAATLTRVLDTTELALAGLDGVCTSGYVFKLDNSAGSTEAHADMINGTVGNLNTHSISCYARTTAGVCTMQLAETGIGIVTITGSSYTKYISENLTPASTANVFVIEAKAGAVVYFILNKLEEKDFVTSEIIIEGSAVTRNKDDLSYPTTNIPVNDCVFSFDWTPTAAGQDTAALYGSGDANDHLTIFVSGTTIFFKKRVSSTSYQISKALTYVDDTTYSVKGRLSSIDGIDLWIDGVKTTGNANTSDAVYGANIYIGSYFDNSLTQTGGINNFTVHSGSFTDAEVVAL